MEERTGWRGQNESQTGEEEKRNGSLYGVAETSKERAEWRRLQRKNFNPLSAELIFLFSSYSAYLIARFAFFSVSIIFATAKFCGKVPDGQFQTFNSRERNFA